MGHRRRSVRGCARRPRRLAQRLPRTRHLSRHPERSAVGRGPDGSAITRHPVEIYAAIALIAGAVLITRLRFRGRPAVGFATGSALAFGAAVRLSDEAHAPVARPRTNRMVCGRDCRWNGIGRVGDPTVRGRPGTRTRKLTAAFATVIIAGDETLRPWHARNLMWFHGQCPHFPASCSDPG